MHSIEICGISIGEGIPKIAVPVMGLQAQEVAVQVRMALVAGADLIEWRVDYSAHLYDREACLADACRLAAACAGHPLLATLRTVQQGGRAELSKDDYTELICALIESGDIDLVDIEASVGDDTVRDMVAYARLNGVRSVVSHHDFDATPSEERMMFLLDHFYELGADLPKLAVMAQTHEDALRLMKAAWKVRQKRDAPLIALAMGEQGRITRLAGQHFGSALTFCSLQGQSAWGQIDIGTAKRAQHMISIATHAKGG